MSLYAIGKLIPDEGDGRTLALRLRQVASSLGVSVGTDDVEQGDAEVLDSAGKLRADGLRYSLYSAPGETDATALWIEAMDAARAASAATEPLGLSLDVEEALKRTRLVRFVLGVAALPCKAKGIALFDGGIDSIVEGTEEECLRHLFSNLLRPWDQSGNALYVWDE